MIASLGLAPGTLVDGWKVVGALGGGGFGAVHRVEKNGQLYALKLALHREASGDEKKTHARTLREVAILLHLDHPNIVKPRAFAQWPEPTSGHAYVVLDYIDGWTVGEWKERTAPTAQEVCRVFSKIAAALAHMHARGVFHRDLKLSNVLIRKSDSEPIIIDLGCATYAQAEDLTGGGLPPGTEGYRAPETQLFLLKPPRERKGRYPFQVADELFALGVMLYEVLTDPLPLHNHPKPRINLFTMGPEAAHKVNPRVPEALSVLVEDLLERNPAKRPVSAEVVQRRLEELTVHESANYRAPLHPPSVQRVPADDGRGLPVAMAPPSPLRGGQRRALPARVAAELRRWRLLAAMAAPWLSGFKGVALAGLVAAALLAMGGVFLFTRGERAAPLRDPSPAPPALEPTRPPAKAPAASTPAPAPLPQPSPTAAQKEGSSVKTPQADAPKQGSPSRTQPLPPSPGDPKFLAWCKAAPLALALSSGCTNVQVRPEPFECPPGARQAMERLGWEIGKDISLKLDDRGPDRGHHWYSPGPVVGVVPPGWDHHGVPAGTVFYGQVYLSREPSEVHPEMPGELIAKYDRVKIPNGGEHPVCFIVGGGGYYVTVGVHEFKDGKGRARSIIGGETVDRWP